MHTQTVTNSERKQTVVRSRLGLKVLGLCALALGLMAFVASAAQAEMNARWKVAGSEITGANFAHPVIREIEGKTGSLLFTTKGGTKVTILCTTAEIDEGFLLIKEGGVALGRILFKGCVTLLNGLLSSACKPKGGGAPIGEILSEKGKGLIVLDEVAGVDEDYVKITPDEGTLFSKLELGKECSIGEVVKVETKAAGEGFWLRDCPTGTKTSKEQFLTEAVIHLIEESLHGLIALGQPATIDGSANVQLNGGATSWSGKPG
jgi:hypothetical protein